MYILRYLKDAGHYKLEFGPEIISEYGLPLNIEIYTDSDWAHDRADRKSIIGWVMMLNGRPIVWCSKKQATIALSSCEAELYAVGEGVRQALFIKQWVRHYLNIQQFIPLKCDNKGTIQIAKHSTDFQRSKHIDIKYLFVREHMNNDDVKIDYIPTDRNMADILTKPLGTQPFVKFTSQLLNTTRTQTSTKEGV
jgi:hypothetical protein